MPFNRFQRIKETCAPCLRKLRFSIHPHLLCFSYSLLFLCSSVFVSLCFRHITSFMSVLYFSARIINLARTKLYFHITTGCSQQSIEPKSAHFILPHCIPSLLHLLHYNSVDLCQSQCICITGIYLLILQNFFAYINTCQLFML